MYPFLAVPMTLIVFTLNFHPYLLWRDSIYEWYTLAIALVAMIPLIIWWQKSWVEVENDYESSIMQNNKISKFDVQNGYGAERGTMVVGVEWETTEANDAKLKVWSSSGKITLRDNADSVSKQAGAMQIGVAQNGEPFRYVDTSVNEGDAVNYYAWIETPDWHTKAWYFQPKRETARPSESVEERQQRILKEREARAALKPKKPRPKKIQKTRPELLKIKYKEALQEVRSKKEAFSTYEEFVLADDSLTDEDKELLREVTVGFAAEHYG